MERVVRGHYAVGFRWVGSREENGEGSAWMARVGAPRAAIPPCVPEEGGEAPGRRGKTLHQIFSGKFRRPGLQSPLVGLE